MPPGRLISFPNAFQRRMGPSQLQDKIEPGHCRFLTVSIVDPTYRLCSTRNVPPQQTDWTKGDGAESATQLNLGQALELREEPRNTPRRMQVSLTLLQLSRFLDFRERTGWPARIYTISIL